MSKLIFNPEKDLKELEKYGFEQETYYFDENTNDYCKRGYPTNQDIWINGRKGLYIEKANEVAITLYKLYKANLIIDEEELKI